VGKNRIHGVLLSNLILPYDGELFSASGRVWLGCPLDRDEMLAVRRYLADRDQRMADLSVLDQVVAEHALRDERVRRLMTLSGVHVTVAMGLLAAIRDIKRFASSEKLVSYFGLNPSVRQSGNGPAHHGRVSKRADRMPVPCRWKPSGPRRGCQVRSAPSSCVFRAVAASRWRPLPRRASWPSWFGIF
jgi:transposase